MTTLLNSTSYYNGYPLLIHHTMVVPILREFQERNNLDHYRMFTWHGVQIEGAEDVNVGVQDGYPESAPPRNDWEQLCYDGEIEVGEHPAKDFLELARAFFSYAPKWREPWCETPDEDGTLDMFATDAITFHILCRQIAAGRVKLLAGIVKALRNMQNIMKSPIYHFCEVEDGGAPRLMEAAFEALPAESARRLTTGEDNDLFEEAVNLDLVADFLVAKRAFRAMRCLKLVKSI